MLHEIEILSLLSGVSNLTDGMSRDFKKGSGELPLVYTSYFLPPLSFILQKPTAYLKFLVVRSSRDSCTIDGEGDEFSTNISLRSWVDLKSLS